MFQVRPGVVSVASRQNQLPTLLFKNGTVVPIQQASGQLIGHFVYLCGLEYSDITVHCQTSNHTDLWKMYIVLVLWWERLPVDCRDIILSYNFHHSSLGLFHVITGRVKPADGK